MEIFAHFRLLSAKDRTFRLRNMRSGWMLSFFSAYDRNILLSEFMVVFRYNFDFLISADESSVYVKSIRISEASIVYFHLRKYENINKTWRDVVINRLIVSYSYQVRYYVMVHVLLDVANLYTYLYLKIESAGLAIIFLKKFHHEYNLTISTLLLFET